MNNIDKQWAWDSICTQLEQWGLLNTVDFKTQPIQTVGAALDLLRAESLTLKQIQAIAATPPEPTLFTDEELATLKILVSTAVWIRSEQLAHPNAVILAGIPDTGTNTSDGCVAEVDTHNLAVRRTRAEFEAGQKLFTKLAQYCSDHAIADPEWRK